jgi:hypothetical protein
MIMPKKLKAVLARAVLSTVGYTCSLIAIEGLEALLPGSWVWKCKLAAGATLVGFLLFCAWQVYVGLYRDGTFFYDDSDER